MPQNTSQHQRLCGPFSARKTTSENYTIKCKISSLSCCCCCCCWCFLRCCCCCCCQQLEIVIVVICWKFIQTAALLPSRLTATNCSASTARPQFSLQSSFYVLRSSVLSLSVCLSGTLPNCQVIPTRWSQSACQSGSLSHCPHSHSPCLSRNGSS